MEALVGGHGCVGGLDCCAMSVKPEMLVVGMMVVTQWRPRQEIGDEVLREQPCWS